MLPSILARQLQVALADYVKTTFPITNPVFKGSIQRMVETPGALFHESYVNVRLPFRVSESETGNFQAIHETYKPYVHQQIAFDRLTGEDGRSTLIATGTGSGKTECFLYPILEYCYAHRGEPGIKALIIYPMNALASDQATRIAKLIHSNPGLRGNVTAGIYVGGHEKGASTGMSRNQIITDRDTMLASPPDILLTNYKMLDYLLVRPKDAQLWKDNQPETLKYVVVDELHTFDGAQGTDLACLLRRLKNRLYIQPGYLCCVGTSATMGNEASADNIRQYAEKVFGETFEANSVIMEDRLSPKEFFAGYDVVDYTFPTADEVDSLRRCIGDEEQEEFLILAAGSWLEESFDKEHLFSDQGRVELGEYLMGHSFMRDLFKVLDGKFAQPSNIMEALVSRHGELLDIEEPTVAIDSFLALISHARTRDVKGELRPFLHVQVQVWIRELRRLLAKVSADDITFALASDLNDQQIKQYLPVVNCRDCGATGWVSFRDENSGTLSVGDLDKFYNLYFRQDKRIVMVFPRTEEEKSTMIDHVKVRLCPHCLKVRIDDREDRLCTGCNKETMAAWLPQLDVAGPKGNKRYVCPNCRSEGGISIMGLQAVTAVSALTSQLYASHYNDDKKLLAFSDNVQDAAHRAGFFNSRTWNFGVRSAIQQFALHEGDNLPLPEFASSFVDYWREELTPEEFVAKFIPPNLTWMKAFEQMKETGVFEMDSDGEMLLNYLCKRLEYEVFLEFGLQSRIGRTLEKSGGATLAFNYSLFSQAKSVILGRLRNEVGELRDISETALDRILAGWLYRSKINGAFHLDVYNAFIASGGKPYLLSNDRVRWLPGLRKVPRFITRARTRSNHNFDVPNVSSWYGHWLKKSLEFEQVLVRHELYDEVAGILVEELRNHKILIECYGPGGLPVWALNPAVTRVSTQVTQMVCDTCGNIISTATEDVKHWEESHCTREGCLGRFAQDQEAELDYYGKLYSKGDITRIFAHEHTGLLQRDQRENLEAEFKRQRAERKPWDSNLLSSTPTLEMGIDIGDLSTVVLCNIPPGQAQYVQRVGRAGRKDGNTLSIAVANAQPHDLFFYSEPLEMIGGSVQAPDVFLNASAVLERQFVAYCMDCWVKSGIAEEAVPRKVGSCLNKLKSRPIDFFPFNFLNYVQNNLATLHRRFIAIFADQLSEDSVRDLIYFAKGDGFKESPMHMKVLESFESLYEQREALRKSIKQLKAMIDDLESKPHDSSFEDELRELKSERNALAGVVRSINNKDVFNFLSDEGLLPNYAFPESGIILKAVLYRREKQGYEGKKNYERFVYEYNRAASAAISEFAPSNNFYVGGRKLSIDQIDLSTTQSAKWRLCPNCSHAQLDESGKSVASCPKCGSVGWADSGQVRSMLQVKMVYSEMDYTKSLIGDEERRSNVFYLKQMLVDVDDEDVISAYRVGGGDPPFGYEFARKATLREINFGENDIIGEKLVVAGVEEIRKGFVICRFCGKVQHPDGPARHTMTCRARKQTFGEPFEECMFLYRKFDTEVLRILIPSTTMEWSKARLESFVAGFMLGMKGYFGNVDHLEACVSEIPVEGSAYRKQYLVIYDSVPGGTGYLKQLMRSESSMIKILEKAIEILEKCNCKDDPQKDGCYRCLYAYRQSRHIGEISRKEALGILRKIVASKDDIEQVDKLGSIPVNSLFESELERQFIGAFERLDSKELPIKIDKGLVNNKEGFHLQVGRCLWGIEPQVDLDHQSGVLIHSRADFVFWPLRSTQKQKPVVIFTDGFQYHKDRVDTDTLQRLAITKMGNYRIWTLTWKDVQHLYRSQGDYCPSMLIPEEMPSGLRMYKPIVQNGKAEDLQPDKLGAFELLTHYLADPNAEAKFIVHAKAYAFSLLQRNLRDNEEGFREWMNAMAPISEALTLWGEPPIFGNTFFGQWLPRTTGVRVLSGVSIAELSQNGMDCPPSVACVFDDRVDYDHNYEANWNAFWHFANMMQFLPSFAAVTSKGLERSIYESLSLPHSKDTQPVNPPTEWAEIYEGLFDDLAKAVAYELETIAFPPPSALGYELTNEKGEIVAEAEMAWENLKIVWLLPTQEGFRVVFESHGWTVYVGDDTPQMKTLGQEA